ncbi:hypothetical protein CANCADRAFT_100606 [Tortispora caseinolytica NRRL Y-17796]|uniref:Replication factor C subunit 5 n=1 Tax=Tortispora caseinolytica NRRL Y-17796 TaxID=767744 RepID=A0A1E4TED6_9ASCO|nr:hypothetical protein CANCADRAFT_100606 [Tortispora caseinolytica NRRL Y-17796]
MLWVDKYAPKTLKDLDLNDNLTDRLKSLAYSEDLPHLLVYGPSGAGKKTRVSAVLHALYGNSARNVKLESRTFAATASRKVEFTLIVGPHHFELTPSDLGPNNDRIIIQELIKELAQSNQVTKSAHRFRVVVINEADTLSRDAQAALRRTMEKYTTSLRLVLVAQSTSNIIEPIKSRTLQIRVPAPDYESITRVLNRVAQEERISPVPLPEELLAKIFAQSGRNLRRALLSLEAAVSVLPGDQQIVVSNSTTVPPADWREVITEIAQMIIKVQSASQLLAIRGKYYDLIAHCIPPRIIIKTLLTELLTRVSSSKKPSIVTAAALYDHRIQIGNKSIFHLEAFTAKVMNVLEH